MGRQTGTVLKRTLEKYEKIDELYKQGLNAHEISKIIKMNAWKVGKYFKEKGYVLTDYNQKHSANYSVFETIDTEDKAYWLGFLFADGSITYDTGSKKRYVVEVSLKYSDLNHLEKLRQFIGTSKTITEKKIKLGDKEYLACRLQVYSKKMCEDLIKLGCTPRKSLTLFFPEIKPELRGHFLRGYFDGDGGAEHKSVEILGTIQFLNYIQRCLGTDKPYRGHGKAFGLRLSGDNLRKFVNWIYKDASVYLERKHVKIARYISNDITHNPNNG